MAKSKDDGWEKHSEKCAKCGKTGIVGAELVPHLTNKRRVYMWLHDKCWEDA